MLGKWRSEYELKYNSQFVKEFWKYDPFIIWEAMKILLNREVKLNIKKAPQVAYGPGDPIGRRHWQETMRAGGGWGGAAAS